MDHIKTIPGVDKNIIDGFKIRVSTAEMRTHLQSRVEFHQAEAGRMETVYVTTAEKFTKESLLLKDVDAGLRPNGMGDYIPRRGGRVGDEQESALMDIKTKILRHKDRAETYDYFARHLIEGFYDLSPRDADGLELVSARRLEHFDTALQSF